MKEREALIAVLNMAKRVQLDHRYKNCKYHNTYMRQNRAVKIIETIIKEKLTNEIY